ALEDLRQAIQRQVDAMVGDASLRIVVRADALAAIARADLQLARRRFGLLLPFALALEELGLQALQRLVAIRVLRALVLALDDDAGRQMRDADRRVGLVDVLSAGAGRAERVDLEVDGIDLDVVDRVDLRQDRDGRGRSMDAALRLGLGHALHAMRARFELEPRE